MNILHLTERLDYTDGVSSHLYYLTKHTEKKNIYNFILCSGFDAADKFKYLMPKIFIYENISHKKRGIINFFLSVVYIYFFCKKHNINIIHSHNHYCANIANRVSRLLKVKTLQTVHGLLPEGGRLSHFSSMYFIGVNDHILNYLYKSKISDEQNTRLIYNGVDFAEEEMLKTQNNIRIITASRLVKEKGVDTFIRAVSQLDDIRKSKCEFIIAGKGEYEKDLIKLNNNLKAEIKFAGCIKDLSKFLKSTHIFVVPTASDSEGFPMTIPEAASTKNIIVSSDFTGSEFIFGKNEGVLIFKRHDAEDLKNKLAYAIENYNKLNILSEIFYEKAKKNFNSVNMAEKHIDFYKLIS